MMPYIVNPDTGNMEYYDEAWKVGMTYINFGVNPEEEIGYGEWNLIAKLDIFGEFYS
jgi:hypothetical protein